MGLPIIGKMLGHTQATTTARYAILSADPFRAANDAVSARARRCDEREARRHRIA
jgi:hypothetical protein